MTAITFDTHEFIKTLEAAGIPTEQAEATSVAFQKAQQQSDLATKADIALLQRDIKEAEAHMMGEQKLIRWMVALSIAVSLGLLSLIIKIAIKVLA